MRRRLALAVLLPLIAAPAQAEEASLRAVDAESAAVAEFREAVSRAAPIGEQRWAFSVTYQDLSAAGGKSYRLRFDPRQPEGERWTPIEPAALTKEERGALAQISRNDEADDALVYERLGEQIEAARVLSVSPESAVFRIEIDEGSALGDATSALAATATLDRRSGHVAEIAVVSEKPFKPASVAKIDKLRQLQFYAPVGPAGAVLMTGSESELAGSAMFKKFSSRTRFAYSDYEAVEAPPFKRKAAATPAQSGQ